MRRDGIAITARFRNGGFAYRFYPYTPEGAWETYSLDPATSAPGTKAHRASCPSLKTSNERYGNINPLSIG